MTLHTNLASRPFRNERLPWAIASLALICALTISAWHLRTIRGLLAGQEAKAVSRVRSAEERIREIAATLKETPPPKLASAEIARYAFFKDLVDRRAFSWRGLLAQLEDLLPSDVRLTKIAPAFARGRVTISMSAEAKSKEAAFALAEALESSDAFSEARIGRIAEEASTVAFDIDALWAPLDSAVRSTTPVSNGTTPASPVVADKRTP